MKIEIIDNKCHHLDTIKNLWRESSNTLGFFPDGAFNDYASKRQILVALSADNNCVGYLLYRWSGNSVAIVHLCIDKNFRKKGIAKELVNNLINLTKKCLGIGLRCRRDYEASKMWPQLGFVARQELEGKNKEGKLLTFWWHDHGHQTLFTYNAQQLLESKVCAVIDANVFFDLQEKHDPDSEESKSLTADWLSNTLELCVTEEIYNEIHRGNDNQEREYQRKIADSYTTLPCNTTIFRNILPKLRNIFTEKMSESDHSDLRQLARTVASDVQYFVTRDKYLLNQSDTVYQLCKVLIIRPADLIIHLDELQRGSEYQPIRLAATDIKIKRVQSKREDVLTRYFQNSSHGESKSSFQRLLWKFLSNTSEFDCNVIWDKDNQPIVLIVYCRSDSSELEIPLFRACNKSLSSTIIRCMILKTMLSSIKENRTVIRITDKYLDDNILAAIQQDNFINMKNSWTKICLPLAEKASSLTKILGDIALSDEASEINDILSKLSNTLNNIVNDPLEIISLEKMFWPLKIVDASIPNFIISIKPTWAKELFDENLAKDYIFSPKTELALQRESVYYRARYPSILEAPGRILWYISSDKSYSYNGSKKLRACSHIDEVVIGKPKDLHRRFRRLGVYEWNDIFELAKRDKNKNIMAIRFSDTELFDRPIPWKRLKEYLNQNGINFTFQSPRRISNSIFEYLYKTGKNYC